MRIPEPLFPIINRIMALLLSSPLHVVMSNSVLVVYFTGRKSGQRRFTPLRYLRQGDTVTCTTDKSTGWWHNFRTPAQVELQLAGRRVSATASVTVDDAPTIEPVLLNFLNTFPQDAPYHQVTLGADRKPPPDQLEHAVRECVVVSFVLTSSRR